jgi:xylan 1,4-beta-xylosidase
MKALHLLILGVLCCSVTSWGQQKNKTIETRKITADYSLVKGTHDETFRQCIGAGRANEGLRADWQKQLKTVQDEIGFRYIRFHGLLSDDMGLYKEDAKGNPQYNYQYIDALFDYLLSINIRPFVELGFMPQALASGSKTIFWWRGNVTPPKSYEKWGALIHNLVQHWEQRYSRDEVKKWYFEVWNEPDLSGFFSGTLEEYLKLYDTTVKEIKSICPDYKVGGPASASPYKYETEFVKHCAENHIPVDFISSHSYGVKAGFLDEFGNQGTILDQDPMAVSGRMRHSRELIKQSALPNLELHFTEWSTSYTPSDPVHDAYQSAAFILDKVKNTEGYVNSLSYWVFTDIFEEAGPRWTPFHGGFGLMNYQSIKKPAYYAYRYMAQLGKTELSCNDPATWICKDEQGDMQILLWNFTLTKPTDSVNNQVYYRRDLPAKNKGEVEVNIQHVPDGKYLLKVFQTGYRVNDAYATYFDMGNPDQLTKEQENTIKAINNNDPVSQTLVDVKNGSFTKKLPIRENDVFFMTLSKAD